MELLIMSCHPDRAAKMKGKVRTIPFRRNTLQGLRKVNTVYSLISLNTRLALTERIERLITRVQAIYTGKHDARKDNERIEK